MDEQTKDFLKEGVILLIFHVFIALLVYVCILQIKEQKRYNANQRGQTTNLVNKSNL